MRARVLITRSAERSVELMNALQDAGITAIAEPVTFTTRIADAAMLPDLSRVNWIAFTSANAVAAFSEILEASGRALPANVRFAAVGIATAQQVRNRLHASEIVCGSATGADLAQAILEVCVDEKRITVLWPCAQASQPGFADNLSAAGADVIEWPVYATEAVPPWTLQGRLERPSSFDAVVFAAPSAVKSLRDAWPEPWTFAAIAIGPTTADALRQTGMAESLISRSPRAADIVAKVLEALSCDSPPSALPPVSTSSAERR